MNQQTLDSSQSFATYMAKQFQAKKPYVLGTVPEASALTEASDIILTRSDGMTFIVMCLIDRESNPGKRFSLSPETVRDIGKRCLKYAGKVNRTQMPVVIQILEIGNTPIVEADRQRLKAYKRQSIFSKVMVSAWILDTRSNAIWSNSFVGNLLAPRGFLSRLMREPRSADADLVPPKASVIAPQRFPFLTWAMLAILAGAFGIELMYGVEPFSGLLAPSLNTLIALGGLNKSLVLHSGEWYRVVSAVVLHANIVHLLMNSIALLIVGYVLESLVGRLWFAALFSIGALSGSAMSLAINPDTVISVGASGAIMGLFAAAFVCSFRLPAAANRTPVQISLLRVLIPSLIPLATTHSGGHIDFGAHLGGALGGTVAGLVLLKNWDRTSTVPKFRVVAGSLAIAALVALTASAAAVAGQYARQALNAKLIPNDQLPKTDGEAKARSADYVGQYPGDPRSHLFRAAAQMDASNVTSAESELRTALANGVVLHTQFQPQLELRLTTMLATVLLREGRFAEARATAKPACLSVSAGDLRAALDKEGLCR
jgi:rhomboid protease GluP